MAFLRQIFPVRASVVAVLLLVLQSVLLLQFPLLNVLGLEFSVATSILVSLLAGSSVLLKRDVDESIDARTALRRNKWTLVAYISIPLVFGLLNGLRVVQCAVWEGLLYYILIVPFATAVGVCFAILSAAISHRAPRTLFVLCWLGVLLQIPFVTFFGHQIFAYNPIVGFFPGFSYDDALDALPGLALYRVSTLLLIVALLCTARLVREMRAKSIASIMPRNAAIIAWVALAIVWIRSDAIGFSSSLSHVRDTLGGVRETEHFTMLYPAESVDSSQADRLAQLHEFHYSRLSRTLRVDTRKKIVSVIYASPSQKALLCGGGSTNFSKPWLWQMHITLADAERVLKHELSHVLAAEFGFPVVRVSTNAGLIEGLAVAIERESYGMSLHRASAAIFSVRPDIDVTSLFGVTGFFSSHSSVSYTLAGSFCRFLIERYDVRTFKRAYASGSFSWYGKPMSTLVREWMRRVEEVQLTPADSAKAEYLFRRPPQFTEECYRFKGNLLRSARVALARGDDSLALAQTEQSLRRTVSFDGSYLKSVILVRLRRYREALETIEAYAANDPEHRDLPMHLVEGDARWGSGDADGAWKAYDEVAASDLSDGWTESALLRRGLVRLFPKDTTILALLSASMPDSLRAGMWKEILGERDHPYLRLAASRVLNFEDDTELIIAYLEQLVVPDEPYLSYVAKMRTARAYLEKKMYERAKGNYWEAQNFTTDEVRLRTVEERIEWAEWLRRADSERLE